MFPDLFELYLVQESLRIVWREYTASQMNINSVGLGAKKILIQYLICIYEGDGSVLQGFEHGGMMSFRRSGISASWEKNSTYSLNQTI